jgi:hypothetical protein
MNTIQDLVIQFAIQLAVDLFIIFYLGFFALHAAQHVADPIQRAGWIILIVFLNIFGATLYLCTKYRKFRAISKGGLIVDKRPKWVALKDWASLRAYFDLSEAERVGL